MATIQQQIEVAAEPALVASNWARFIQWAHTGPGHLVCDDLACVDAVRAGLVDFVPTANGRTTVIFRMDLPEEGPAPEELQRQLGVSVDGNFGPETRAELLAQFGLDVNRLVLPNHFEGGVFAGGTSIVGPDGTKRFR